MPPGSSEGGYLEANLCPVRHLDLWSAARWERGPECLGKYAIHRGEIRDVCQIHRTSHDVGEGEIEPSEYVHDDLDGAFRLACDIAAGEFARRMARDLTREENEVTRDDGVRIRAICLGNCRLGKGMPFDCLHVRAPLKQCLETIGGDVAAGEDRDDARAATELDLS